MRAIKTEHSKGGLLQCKSDKLLDGCETTTFTASMTKMPASTLEAYGSRQITISSGGGEGGSLLQNVKLRRHIAANQH